MTTQAQEGQLAANVQEIEDVEVAEKLAEACANIEFNRTAASEFAKSKRIRKDLLGVESLEEPAQILVRSPQHGDWLINLKPGKREGHTVDDGTTVRISAEKQ